MDSSLENNIKNRNRTLKSEVSRNKWIYLFIILTTLLSHSIINSLSISNEINYSFTTYIDSLIKICTRTLLIWCTYEYVIMVINKTPRPITTLIKKIISSSLPIYKLYSFSIMLILLNLSLSTYSHIKRLIPDINPYYLDNTLFLLDKTLHLNHSPWEITHVLFSTPELTLVLDFLYQIWFILIWGFLLFFILYRKNDLLRNQFILSFLTCWILIGSLLATLLSSAGPCFVHNLDSNNLRYLELMTRLKEQFIYIQDNYLYSLKAIEFQNILWELYINKTNGIGVGISAMPSMHVSMSILMALSSYKINKKLGIIMWTYAFFIQVGSVHLAWHYAVDGYISCIVTICIWMLWGKLFKKI